MIKFLTLYSLVFLVLLFQTYLDRFSKTLMNLFLILQGILFFNPIKNLILTLTTKGITIEFFILMSLTPCLIGFYLQFTKNRPSRFKTFFGKFYQNTEKYFNELLWYNLFFCYWSANFFLFLATKGKVFIYRPFFAITVFIAGPQTLLISVAVLEFLIQGKFKLSIALFFLNFFLYRVMRFYYYYVNNFSQEAVAHNWGEIKINLPNVPCPPRENEIFIFLKMNFDILKWWAFSKESMQENFLFKKFDYLTSILHMTTCFLISKITLRYFALFYRNFFNVVFFIILLFLFLFSQIFVGFNKIIIIFLALDFLVLGGIILFYVWVLINNKYLHAKTVIVFLTQDIPYFMEYYRKVLQKYLSKELWEKTKNLKYHTDLEDIKKPKGLKENLEKIDLSNVNNAEFYKWPKLEISLIGGGLIIFHFVFDWVLTKMEFIQAFLMWLGLFLLKFLNFELLLYFWHYYAVIVLVLAGILLLIKHDKI